MRKFKGLYWTLVTAMLVLTGCVDFSNSPGVSVWSEGAWILPLLSGLGSAVFFYFAYKGSKSGSYVKIPDPDRPNIPGATKEVPSDVNVPIYQFGQFYFGIGLAIATIFIIWNTISNR